MNRYFNITGSCNPQEHYMVNLDSRLAQIKKMVDAGQYFAINKGRQYGKTTMLDALQEYLKQQYSVIFLDFQSQMSTAMFENEAIFANAFADAFIEAAMFSNQDALMKISKSQLDGINNLVDLFRKLSFICKLNDKKIILMIDEVDSAANNQVFLDFLAQLREYYLQRNKRPTFQSVILAGVHDIRNLRQKIRPDAEHKHNSPWNIASSFDVDMSFSVSDIAGMLEDYENDYHTGINIKKISQLIYDYTSGYPVLVSTICKWMDEKNTKWTAEDLTGAVKQVITDRSPLFESLINKLEDDETLRSLLYAILFQGKKFLFSAYDATIYSAMMYGFVKNQNGAVAISNRIFETVIYDWFISLESTNHPIFSEGVNDKSQFIMGNQLNMEKILEKFVLHFNDIYGTKPDKFKEDDGRKLFLLYLRPIINGTGNYYIESQTRDQKRTDVIVDYLGQQYIIELKIWRGEEYNTEGEQQLSEYLDYYHIDKGYLLSFNFNKKKQSGVHTIELNSRTIVEAVV
ncbi:MAG: AAA-like domain-containing protein [Oscillospiraceae bacterium]|nr:AAA-like domain-containing protein [Oscillospiraceae bacterium]